jgi:protein arginine N-methyltransferase 1
MECLEQAAMQEPIVDICEREAINSTICRIYELDLYTCKVSDLDFSNKYELSITRKDTVHGFIAWFDISFDKLPNKVHFTTGPFKKHTHWKQTVFYTERDIHVKKGILLI